MAKKPKMTPRKPPATARDGKTTTYTRRTGEAAGEALRRVTLYFPEALHKRAKIAAINEDIPLSEFVVRLVAQALSA